MEFIYFILFFSMDWFKDPPGRGTHGSGLVKRVEILVKGRICSWNILPFHPAMIFSPSHTISRWCFSLPTPIFFKFFFFPLVFLNCFSWQRDISSPIPSGKVPAELSAHSALLKIKPTLELPGGHFGKGFFFFFLNSLHIKRTKSPWNPESSPLCLEKKIILKNCLAIWI